MRDQPRDALILAAGFGTRLLPMTRSLPKPLMPLWGTPMLEHTIRLLCRHGVERIWINTHHGHASVAQCAAQLARKYSVRISISYEQTILGTGGALTKLKRFLDKASFWMVNADVATDLDLGLLLEPLTTQHNALASLWLIADKGPQTVMLDDSRHVTSFRRGTRQNGGVTFAGIQLIQPEIFDFLPETTQFYSIITAYENAMANGWKMAGICSDTAYWSDIGNPADYLSTHAETARAFHHHQAGQTLYDPNADADFESAILPDTWIDPTSSIHNSVIMNEVRISGNTTINHAIIMPRTEVTRDVYYIAMNAAEGLTPEEQQAIAPHWTAPWDQSTLYVLPPGGSDRAYMRVVHEPDSVMLCRYKADRRPENARFTPLARVLESIDIPVPAIFSDDGSLLAMEDCGDQSLLSLFTQDPQQCDPVYTQCINHLSHMHKKGLQAVAQAHISLEPMFDASLYAWEIDLFIDHFVKGWLHASPALCESLRSEARICARQLEKEPPVLVHRDLQSSNLIIHKQQLVFIDFQGARSGPAVYDLASLLYDPYVHLSNAQRKRLLEHYRMQQTHSISDHAFYAASAQRLMQALGAYGRLSGPCGVERFARYIPVAWNNLLTVSPLVASGQQLNSLLQQLDLHTNKMQNIHSYH
ncbi:MAG: hypothetical protein EOL87_15515 [Spartobacteria bacterium]|nr:hypothetical protein [Spartobacteria bacterium]